jgi:hypothetical protein
MGDIETGGLPVPVPETKAAKPLPTLKSAKAAAAVSGLVLLLPVAQFFFPQFTPVFTALSAVAKVFGYGV